MIVATRGFAATWRVSRAAGIAAALCLAALLLPASAAALDQGVPVVVVPGLTASDLEQLQSRGAVGLLVPGAGPRVSEASARAALERGTVRNSLRGGLPSGPAVIALETAAAVPQAEPVVVVGIPRGGDQPNDRRYPVAVLAPGWSGLLVSETTRVPGLVSAVDIAPTVLGLEDALTYTPHSAPVDALRDLDARIDDNARSRSLAALVAAVAILLLAAWQPRAALLGFATVLAANLALGAAGVSTPWLAVTAIGLAAAVGAPLCALVVRTPFSLGLILTAVIAAYLAVFALEGSSVALSPLGATEVSRFYGLSNLLSALLLVPALGGAFLLWREVGWLAGLGVAALALATVAGSRFGADGGTAIVLVSAYAVLAVELSRARRRAVLAVAALAGAGIAALLVLDVVTGTGSHVTDAVGGGPGGLAQDLRDRIVLSYARATDRWYYAVLVACGAIVLALLAARLLVRGVSRHRRALPLSLAVATGVSLLVNDSPLDVVAVGLVGYVAAQAYVIGPRAELESDLVRA